MRTRSQRCSPLLHRHEVGDANGAAVADELGLEDQRLVAVALLRFAHGHRRADGPGAVLVVADQRREAGIRVEARRAQPVDGATARDQRRGLGVADESVVFDARCHGDTSGLSVDIKMTPAPVNPQQHFPNAV